MDETKKTVTWEHAIYLFEEYLKLQRGLSDNSIKAYLSDLQKLRTFLDIMGYECGPDGVTHKMMTECLSFFSVNGVGDRTQVRVLSGIKSFFKCLMIEEIVEKDPTEQGDRALLNFGHTIGHAIEKYMNFELTHGECISLGAVAAAFISWKRNMISMEEYYEVRDMYVPFYLPISIDHIDPQAILQLTKADKKVVCNQIKFILLKRIGKAVIDETVTDAEILDAINEIYFNEEEDGRE